MIQIDRDLEDESKQSDRTLEVAQFLHKMQCAQGVSFFHSLVHSHHLNTYVISLLPSILALNHWKLHLGKTFAGF